MCKFTSRVPILFHCALDLFLCQYLDVLSTAGLFYILKACVILPPNVDVLLKISLIVCSFFLFPLKF